MKKQTKSLCLLVFLSALGTLNIHSQTIQVSDTIQVNTTWSADTVKVIDDITVEKEAILTIEPGTTIEFQGHFN